MLANYDRIYKEIEDEAKHQSPPGVDSEELVALVMNIVDEVDQHQLRPKSINKNIQNLILNFSGKHEGLFQ